MARRCSQITGSAQPARQPSKKAIVDSAAQKSRQPLIRRAKPFVPTPGGPRLPREIMAMIYIYVKDADHMADEPKTPDVGTMTSPTRSTSSTSSTSATPSPQPPVGSQAPMSPKIDTVKRSPPMFPLLALVDRWSCEFVARYLYRSFTIADGDTILHRLIRIKSADRPRDGGSSAYKKGSASSANPTWSDMAVYPCLRRYHQLRRISHVTIPASRCGSILPDESDTKAFLDHIGEPGPLIRQVHLDISNETYLVVRPGCRAKMRRLKALFHPKSVTLTGSNSSATSTVYQTANALSKIWPHIPIRVLMPRVLPTGPDCIVPSPDTWIHYVVGALDRAQEDENREHAKLKLSRASIDSVIGVIGKQMIARARSSRIRLEFSFPNHDAGSLSESLRKIMTVVVDAETTAATKAAERSRMRIEGYPNCVLKGLRLIGLN